MAARSTRNKIRAQGKLAIEAANIAQEHLIKMARLAEGRSATVDENAEILVAGLDTVTKAIESFYMEI